jgi:hypothetical protein
MNSIDTTSSVEKGFGDMNPSFLQAYQNHLQDILFSKDQEKVLFAIQCFRTLSAPEGKFPIFFQ